MVAKKKRAAGSLKEAFFKRGRVPGCPVYDMHGHMGPFYGARFPKCDTGTMVQRMDRAGVRMLVDLLRPAVVTVRADADELLVRQPG